MLIYKVCSTRDRYGYVHECKFNVYNTRIYQYLMAGYH